MLIIMHISIISVLHPKGESNRNMKHFPLSILADAA